MGFRPAPSLPLAVILASALAMPAGAAKRFTPKFEAAPSVDPGDAELFGRFAERLKQLKTGERGVFNPKTLKFDDEGKPAKVEIGKELEGAPEEAVLENPTCDGWKRGIAEAAAKVVDRTLVSKGITVASLVAQGYLPAAPACPDSRLPGKYTLTVSRTGLGVFACKCRCTRHRRTVSVTVNRGAEMRRCAANVKAVKGAYQRYVKEKSPPAAPDLVDLVGAGFLSAADVACPLKGNYLVTATVANGKVKRIVIRCSLCGSSR